MASSGPSKRKGGGHLCTEAHSQGLCSAVYDNEGTHLLTAGQDGQVKIYELPREGEEECSLIETLYDHNQPVTVLAMSPNGLKFASGGQDHTVKFYLYPDARFEANVTRFTLPIRSLAFSVSGGMLAAAGDDEGIKLISTVDSSIIRVLKGHDGAVLSLAFDPKNEFLASADADGTVIYWEISSGRAIHTLHRVAPKADSSLARRNTVAWHPDGGAVAVPGRVDKGVVLFDRDTAEKTHCFKGAHTECVVTLAWSPSGRYLATAGEDRQVLLWDAETRQDLASWKADADVCGLVWRPVGNALTVLDMQGRFSLWDAPVPSHMESPTAPPSALAGIRREDLLKFDNDDDDDADGNDPAGRADGRDARALAARKLQEKEKEKREREKRARQGTANGDDAADNAHLEDSGCDDDEEEGETAFRRRGRTAAAADDDDRNDASLSGDDSGEDSRGRGSRARRGGREGRDAARGGRVGRRGGGGGGEGGGGGGGGGGRRDRGGGTSAPTPQAPFQPGATQAAPAAAAAGAAGAAAAAGGGGGGAAAGGGSKKRFLAYTLLGCIATREGDNGCSHVEVEFHDTSRGSRIPAMTDYFGFTMGALGEKGCILANPARGPKAPSTLMYRPFHSWASNSEWSMRFEAEEEVRAVAVGKRWAAAATSLNLLYIFSEGGIQRSVVSLEGPVVALAAHEHLLAIVTHAAAPTPAGDQVMSFAVYDVAEQRRAVSGRLPLSPGTTLTWLGFSEAGVPATYDSAGVLRVYSSDFDGCWVPIFRSTAERKSGDERHWLVGLNDTQLFFVVCKLPDAQPQVSPRPVLSILAPAIPLGHSDLSADKLEADLVHCSLRLSQARARANESIATEGVEDEQAEDAVLRLEGDLDRCLLRLIAAACKADKLVRALELASMLVLHKSLEGAIRLVTTLRLPALAERLNVLLEEKMRMDETQAAGSQEDSPTQPGYHPGAHSLPSFRQPILRQLSPPTPVAAGRGGHDGEGATTPGVTQPRHLSRPDQSRDARVTATADAAPPADGGARNAGSAHALPGGGGLLARAFQNASAPAGPAATSSAAAAGGGGGGGGEAAAAGPPGSSSGGGEGARAAPGNPFSKKANPFSKAEAGNIAGVGAGKSKSLMEAFKGKQVGGGAEKRKLTAVAPPPAAANPLPKSGKLAKVR